MHRFEEDEKIEKLKKGKRTDGVRFSSPKEIRKEFVAITKNYEGNGR